MSKFRVFFISLGKYLLSAIVTTAVLFGVASVLNRETASLADRIDRNTTETIREVKDTQHLLCDILAEADTKAVREAVKRYCP